MPVPNLGTDVLNLALHMVDQMDIKWASNLRDFTINKLEARGILGV
jgi:hypothetical protein